MHTRTLGGWCITNYIQSEYSILGTVFRYCTLQVLSKFELGVMKEVPMYLKKTKV